MGLLDKLGLHRKKKVMVPFTFDKLKKDQTPGRFNREYILKILLCVTFLVLVVALYPKDIIPDLAYSIGEPWRDDDLTAPFTFSLLKEEAELQSEIRQIRETTLPIFLIDLHVEVRSLNQVDTIFARMDRVMESFVIWQQSQRGGSASAEADSLLFYRTREQSGIQLDGSAWNMLLSNYADIHLENRQTTRRPGTFIGRLLHNELTTLLGQLYSDGIIDISRNDIPTPEITIRNLRDRTQRDVRIQNVRGMRQARDYTRNQLLQRYDEDLVRAGMQILNQVLEPNLLYSPDDTEALVQERIDAISPTKGAVTSGQVIIRRGDIITQERHNMLQSLYRARLERATDIEVWKQYAGETILVVAIFLIFLFYIYLFRKNIFDHNQMLLLVFLILALVYAISAFVAHVEGLTPYAVPIAIAPVLLTIIFDSRVGLMATMMLALTTGLMFGKSFEFVVATITAASMGVYSVRDIKDRSQFYLTTPVLIFFTYSLVLLGFTLTKVDGWGVYTGTMLYLVVNSVGIWLTYPLILLIEKTFKITTDVTLLELSDTNQPILKKLMLEAPGSFHHSLQVANLSEAAAAGIGANALLCRVGALYHDIGKLDKPQYFVENQQSGNAHDKLKPRMSALIIKNHVDAGIKMAKDIELPEMIIDFIRSHHGNSLIRFFYEKALNESDNEQEIQEEDFRYDGPIPNTKETGILLLADGIEAASRSMSDHSYQKLDNLVNRMVDDRLTEGQLNNCDLTFRDLATIKQVFIKILVGMYHARIKYPGQETGSISGSEIEVPSEDATASDRKS